MPDHLHLFCAPNAIEFPPVKEWAAFWKSRSAASWPAPYTGKVWKRDCWDTQLRVGESCHEKWIYVQSNPVRRNLVADPAEWLFQGELNVLNWHD
jgi:putative transposase